MSKELVELEINKQMEILIFQAEDGQISVDVQVDKETVWLSLDQLSELFGRDRSVIAKHIKNILKTKELPSDSTVAKIAKVQIEGSRQVTREVEYYNLDMIISLGYRVNSKRGIQFRKWATQVLKDHLIKGYTINQKRLALEGMGDLQRSINLLSRTLAKETNLNDVGAAAITLIEEYSKTWQLLLQYDENRLIVPQGKESLGQSLDILAARKAILDLKQKLAKLGEASELFGIDKENNLDSILKNIEQTFAGQALYPSVQLRAAHLLYFIIKDHPFIDGNKRIGCFLFILYLRLNTIELIKLNDISLTALALLVAESNPSEKELIVKLITNLIN